VTSSLFSKGINAGNQTTNATYSNFFGLNAGGATNANKSNFFGSVLGSKQLVHLIQISLVQNAGSCNWCL
jgi:hypothetical protein